MAFDIGLIVAGLVLLFLGGESLLRGAVALAERMGLSKFLVSAVIVGFGTSMPEMVVSVGAALKGSPDIALGNIVGSNTANILLIIGLSAVMCPILVAVRDVQRDVLMMVFSAILLCGLTFVGVINFWVGALMLATLLGFIGRSYMLDVVNTSAQKAKAKAAAAEGDLLLAEVEVHSTPKALAFCVAGLAMLIFGADWLVQGASSIARGFGIADAVIGLTVVAVGTSLPELATAVVAAYRKHADMIVGNIVGSNVFNILAILGITAMVKPLPMLGQIATLDVWLMLMVTLAFAGALLAPVKIGRLAGIGMLVIYAGYTYWLYTLGA